MSKDEATRLADALEGYPSEHLLPETREAAALLRRWPDAGEPVAQRVPNSRGRHDYWDYGETYSAALTPENLYTVYTQPAEAERIAALEAALEQARVAIEALQQVAVYQARASEAFAAGADALRAIEEVR